MSDKHLHKQWRQSVGLLYTLRNGTNFDEISVTMADGSRSDSARSKRAAKLLAIIDNHEALIRLLKAYVNACLEQDIMLGAITGEAKQLLEQIDER